MVAPTSVAESSGKEMEKETVAYRGYITYFWSARNEGTEKTLETTIYCSIAENYKRTTRGIRSLFSTDQRYEA